MLKRRFWKQNFFMDTRIRMRLVRIRQQWIEDARLNHSLKSISPIPHWQKPVNLCAWTITKKTECLPWIITSIPYRKYPKYFCYWPNIPWGMNGCMKTVKFISYIEIILKTSPTQRFCNFLEKLQKSQFLLGTLLPPLTLGIISFSKNCDFSNFWQFLEKLQKLQKSQLFRPRELGFFSCQ